MWVYADKEIKSHEDLFAKTTDIVYLITYENGKKYVGKKAVRSWRSIPPLKGKKRKRVVLKNLSFIKYEGSHENAEKLKAVKKEILYQCSSRKASTYLECHLQFYYNVLFDDNYLNKNILGKFFDSDLKGLIEEL